MAEEVLHYLQPHHQGIYLDGTVGGGGHARLLLEATAPDGLLIGLDRDQSAVNASQKSLADFGDRAIIRQGNFSELDRYLDALGIDAVDGVVLDLGVSSHQLDSPERGFSFQEEGRLDMRMDPTQGLSAAQVIAKSEVQELRRLFRDYGEERWAGRIAKAIGQARDQQPIVTTLQLAELIQRVVPRGRGPQRIHPATRVFQALRIYVNGELEHLEQGLKLALQKLKVGGRMVVISFHSLEDRIVKHYFRKLASGCICPPKLAECVCQRKPVARLLTRKAIRATDEEVQANPRSRSAVLRALEKIEPEKLDGRYNN
jgi:16S rRNA (cytosine1402-N4)-methyltransferase